MKLTKTQKKKVFKYVLSLIIILIAFITGTIGKEEILEMLGIEKTIVESPSEGYYTVTKVVDGDTIKINYNGETKTVRLIGVDTPESVHPDESKNTDYGKVASEYTKTLLDGKNIQLEFDVEQEDKYGRLLAYVYLDGEMVNKKLLTEGYAQLATYPPNVKYVDEFTNIQKEARENKIGFWSKDVF